MSVDLRPSKSNMLFSSLGASLQDVIQKHPKAYAVAGCLVCAGAYVGVLVLRRGSRELPRNHPVTIRLVYEEAGQGEGCDHCKWSFKGRGLHS